jgi:hypothetical protein
MSGRRGRAFRLSKSELQIGLRYFYSNRPCQEGRYASLRQDRASSLRAADAIQLACAASAGVDLFVTNDNRLHGKHVSGIQFIVPLELVPL